MNEFIKVKPVFHDEKLWLNVNTIERVECDEETGNYVAVVFDKSSEYYTSYRIISDNDALKLVGEYSIC